MSTYEELGLTYPLNLDRYLNRDLRPFLVEGSVLHTWYSTYTRSPYNGDNEAPLLFTKVEGETQNPERFATFYCITLTKKEGDDIAVFKIAPFTDEDGQIYYIKAGFQTRDAALSDKPVAGFASANPVAVSAILLPTPGYIDIIISDEVNVGGGDDPEGPAAE